jgi:uncharacterized protein YkwD
MKPSRSLWALGSVASLLVACAVQPMTPDPAQLAAAAEVAFAGPVVATSTARQPAPVVQVSTAAPTAQIAQGPTATPPLPTPIPYLTPTPITPTAEPQVEAAAAAAQRPAVQLVAPVATATVVALVEPEPTVAVVVESAPTATAVTVAVAPAPGDAYAAALYMVDLINVQRSAAGLWPLVADGLLMSVAQGRVDDMVARGYTGHDDPVTGESLGRKMMQAAGFTSNFLGENWYGTIQPPPSNVEIAMNWFMTDPPHARNILSSNYAYVGVGLAHNGRQWLIVQNFAGLN